MYKGHATPQKLKHHLQAGKEKDPREQYEKTAKQSQQLAATSKSFSFLSSLPMRSVLSPCTTYGAQHQQAELAHEDHWKLD